MLSKFTSRVLVATGLALWYCSRLWGSGCISRSGDEHCPDCSSAPGKPVHSGMGNQFALGHPGIRMTRIAYGVYPVGSIDLKREEPTR